MTGRIPQFGDVEQAARRLAGATAALFRPDLIAGADTLVFLTGGNV